MRFTEPLYYAHLPREGKVWDWFGNRFLCRSGVSGAWKSHTWSSIDCLLAVIGVPDCQVLIPRDGSEAAKPLFWELLVVLWSTYVNFRVFGSAGCLLGIIWSMTSQWCALPRCIICWVSKLTWEVGLPSSLTNQMRWGRRAPHIGPKVWDSCTRHEMTTSRWRWYHTKKHVGDDTTLKNMLEMIPHWKT